MLTPRTPRERLQEIGRKLGLYEKQREKIVNIKSSTIRERMQHSKSADGTREFKSEGVIESESGQPWREEPMFPPGSSLHEHWPTKGDFYKQDPDITTQRHKEDIYKGWQKVLEEVHGNVQGPPEQLKEGAMYTLMEDQQYIGPDIREKQQAGSGERSIQSRGEYTVNPITGEIDPWWGIEDFDDPVYGRTSVPPVDLREQIPEKFKTPEISADQPDAWTFLDTPGVTVHERWSPKYPELQPILRSGGGSPSEYADPHQPGRLYQPVPPKPDPFEVEVGPITVTETLRGGKTDKDKKEWIDVPLPTSKPEPTPQPATVQPPKMTQVLTSTVGEQPQQIVQQAGMELLKQQGKLTPETQQQNLVNRVQNIGMALRDNITAPAAAAPAAPVQTPRTPGPAASLPTISKFEFQHPSKQPFYNLLNLAKSNPAMSEFAFNQAKNMWGQFDQQGLIPTGSTFSDHVLRQGVPLKTFTNWAMGQPEYHQAGPALTGRI